MGTTESMEAIRLAASERGRAAEVLARAFQDDPAYRRIVSDGAARSRSLRALFGAVVGYSLRYGNVYTTPAVEGAACWLAPGNTEITFWRMLRTGMGLQRAVARFPQESRQLLLDALGYLDEIHKRLMTRPHWYLWALGVEPTRQGQGIGGTLIQPTLARSDKEGAPCYLETQNERNVAFYQRWGFEVLAEEVVPGLEVRSWSMLREPRR
jgi:ribosomal protein S18 acetylase RimI-like enzyme